jgi:hypothetical protein
VCYYWVCALRIDAAKMRPVDAMFSAVGVAAVILLLPYSNYVYVIRCLEFW